MRSDTNHGNGSLLIENGTPRMKKGSDRKRPLPNKLGAINKEKAANRIVRLH
jgi:hypothetical protein